MKSWFLPQKANKLEDVYLKTAWILLCGFPIKNMLAYINWAKGLHISLLYMLTNGLWLHSPSHYSLVYHILCEFLEPAYVFFNDHFTKNRSSKQWLYDVALSKSWHSFLCPCLSLGPEMSDQENMIKKISDIEGLGVCSVGRVLA